MNHNAPSRLFVIWQSLVVRSYRTPFEILAAEHGWRVGLCGPRTFTELGRQRRSWDPSPSPTGKGSTGQFPLRATVLHTQAVILWGLRKALRTFFRQVHHSNGNNDGTVPRILCVAEPYSLTALWCLMVCKLYFGRRPFRFLTFGCQNIDKRFPWLLRMVERLVLRASDGIWAVALGQEQVLRVHGYRGPILQIPLWFESQLFSPRDRSTADAALGFSSAKPLRIGFAGSLLEEKGILDLLRAFEESPWLREHCCLAIVGQGPLGPQINTFTNQAAPGSEILLLGSLAADMMPSFFSAIDILAVPSLTRPHWKEQFGRVVVEAQACGALVVASDSGELPWVIRNRTRLFPEGRVDQLRACLEATAKLLRALTVQERRKLAQDGQWGLTCSDHQVAGKFAGLSRI